MTILFHAASESTELMESVITSGSPPEKILSQLDSYGVEWYLTEKGDLLIKSRQIGERDFVPAEQVAKLRRDRPVNSEANALEWVSNHLEELQRECAGKWIAVVDNQIATFSDNLPDLLKQLRTLAIEQPFIYSNSCTNPSLDNSFSCLPRRLIIRSLSYRNLLVHSGCQSLPST